ncbi:MAG: hypothetical protein KGP28_00120 [Bdellovibrionales bacterium]|nr:hypothetical protein [Bdellovibrionales bacterium]
MLGVFFSLVTFFISIQFTLAIEIDHSVPKDQARSIELDQAYLDRLQFRHNEKDEVTKNLLGIDRAISPEVLREWLGQRVALIISERMDLEKSILVGSGRVVYPEPKTLPIPDLAGGNPKPVGGGSGGTHDPVIVMSNTGAGLYLLGKQNGVLLVLQRTDGSLFPILSPRSGVIQIGSGLFLERMRVNPNTQDHPANSISRLSTLFHEARHSDGNGQSLGFMHAICPEGHAYAGYPACDKNLNGPYTVGAQVLNTLIAACTECGTKEKTILKTIEADSRSRVLRAFINSKGISQRAMAWSDQPERIVSFKKKRIGDLE